MRKICCAQRPWRQFQVNTHVAPVAVVLPIILSFFDHLDERQFRRGDTGLAAALYALRPLHRHVTLEFCGAALLAAPFFRPISRCREESQRQISTPARATAANALESQSDGGSAASRRARDDDHRQPLSAPRHHRRRHGRARLQPAPRAGRRALLHDGDRVRGMHGAEGARLRRHARRLRLPAEPHNKRLEVARPQLRQLGACHVDPRGTAPSGPLLP